MTDLDKVVSSLGNYFSIKAANFASAKAEILEAYRSDAMEAKTSTEGIQMHWLGDATLFGEQEAMRAFMQYHKDNKLGQRYFVAVKYLAPANTNRETKDRWDSAYSSLMNCYGIYHGAKERNAPKSELTKFADMLARAQKQFRQVVKQYAVPHYFVAYDFVTNYSNANYSIDQICMKYPKRKEIETEDDIVVVLENGEVVYKGAEDYEAMRDANWRWDAKKRLYYLDSCKYIKVCLNL